MYLGFTNENQLTVCVSVVRNFINYMLHHDVCNEYAPQLFRAKQVCDQADIELIGTVKLSRSLPGEFGMACSTLCGGYYEGVYDPDGSWFGKKIGLSNETAKHIMLTGIAAMGTPLQIHTARTEGIKVAKEYPVGVEIVGWEMPSEKWSSFFKEQKVTCLGKLKTKRWFNPAWNVEGGLGEDSPGPFPRDATWEFWVEESILKVCVVGMRIEARVRELNLGVVYLDSITVR